MYTPYTATVHVHQEKIVNHIVVYVTASKCQNVWWVRKRVYIFILVHGL